MADERDFLGSGWSFPVRINSRGGIELSRGEDDIAESIKMILSTPKGQRRMRPAFGCGIHDLAFAPNDPATHGQIRHHVTEALALWEPRIEVLAVRVQPDSDDPARLFVDIEYSQRADNQRRNLVYPFYMIPGEE
jgi:uncharacterized protein